MPTTPDAVVELTAATVRAAARRPAVVLAFPFLAPFARPAAPGCCGRAAAGPDVARAVAQLAGLPPGRRTLFKELIGATRVTGRVVRAGRVVAVEF